MIVAIPLGLGLGLALGAVGGGGAVLAIPLLVYVLGQDVHAATTTSLAVVAAAALAAGAMQASRARVCWPQVAVFTPAAIGGAVIGTLGNHAVSGTTILLAFVPVLLAAAVAIWRRADEDEASGGSCPALATPRTLVAGVLVGVLTGFFGVGGGFLVVPALALGMSLPLRRAIATSLVIVAAVSLAALAAHLWRSASLDAGITIAMAAGCVTGSLIGVRLGASLPRGTLGHAFAALVTLVAIYLLAAIAFGGGPPSG